ncbi:MAG: thiamine-phosphate kinase [Bacteroidia bacterium]|nr:thiamine-phosphate kinase [Bacteroidia bacterium]MCZ2276388.1 thiamine-phosphate kinase [Bacteroidia bacterium]
MTKQNNRTELSSLGEFGLINLIAKSVKVHNRSTIKGIGDDAAVIDNKSQMTVITTDMLLENVHFDLSFTPLKHLGYKAIVVNLSDIYAMNAIPQQVLVSIAVSNRFSLEAIEEIYSGINLACSQYKVDLAGGDTNSSASGLVLSITAIGQAASEDIVYRNQAKLQDLICVTGDLGAAYLGLQLLTREKRIFLENPEIQPDITGYDYLLERQLKPEARKDIIELLKQTGIRPTSMIDISDGLASELLHLCTQSRTGCQILENRIPIDMKTAELAEEFNINPVTCALNGGEDYELLFTVHPDDKEKIKTLKDVHIIGSITESSKGYKMLDQQKQEIDLKALGWDAFIKKGV